MRIVISGCAGLGKTTLANILSQILKYPVIPDYLDVVLNERGYKRFEDVSHKEGKKIRAEALKRKIKAEHENENFISDKGVVDYFVHWLSSNAPGTTKERTEEFLDLTKENAKIYDLVIIPTLGRFEIEDNGIRLMDKDYQFKIHQMIKKLYKKIGLRWIGLAFNRNDSPEKIILDLGIK